VTRFLLIRHAHHDYIGNALAGWLPVPLSEQGRREAQDLAAWLAEAGIAAIYSSPLKRTMETAAPLAERLGLTVEVREDLGEIRYGDWTGRTEAEVNADPLWHRFVSHRSTTRAPAGELMIETQVRVVRELESIRQAHTDGVVAVFSHGDVIRSAILYYAGMPIDFYARIDIAPASVSVIEVDERGPRIVKLNETR
jgi:probable phosphomutase (TIGR03848 family)